MSVYYIIYRHIQYCFIKLIKNIKKFQLSQIMNDKNQYNLPSFDW